MKRGAQAVWMVLVLAAAAMACDLTVGGPTPPASPIPVSTEAAGELQDLWKLAVENSQNGDVSVVITEAQLTSFVALKLQEQPDPPLRDVQIFLRDNQAQVFGKATIGSVTTSARIALGVSVTPEGQARFAVEKADFGPVPVPEALLEQLSAAINEAFTGSIGSAATGIRIKSVLIADGQMGITGTVRK